VDQRRFYDARYRLDEKFTKASTYRSTHVVSNLFRKGAKGELEDAPNSSGVRATGTTTTNEQLGGQRRRRGRRGAILVGSTRNSTATFHAKMTSAMKLFAYPLGIGLAMVGILSLLLGVVFSMPESSFTHSIEAQIIMSSLYLVIPIIIGMTLVVGMVMGPVVRRRTRRSSQWSFFSSRGRSSSSYSSRHRNMISSNKRRYSRSISSKRHDVSPPPRLPRRQTICSTRCKPSSRNVVASIKSAHLSMQ